MFWPELLTCTNPLVYSHLDLFSPQPFYGGKVHRLNAEIKNPSNSNHLQSARGVEWTTGVLICWGTKASWVLYWGDLYSTPFPTQKMLTRNGAGAGAGAEWSELNRNVACSTKIRHIWAGRKYFSLRLIRHSSLFLISALCNCCPLVVKASIDLMNLLLHSWRTF